MIEEIKKILDAMEYELTHGICIVDKNRVAKEICQLFERKSQLEDDELGEPAPGAIEKIVEAIKPKADESRLLTPKERKIGYDWLAEYKEELDDFLLRQDAKTASIKDRECQARVEALIPSLEFITEVTYRFYPGGVECEIQEITEPGFESWKSFADADSKHYNREELAAKALRQAFKEREMPK